MLNRRSSETKERVVRETALGRSEGKISNIKHRNIEDVVAIVFFVKCQFYNA